MNRKNALSTLLTIGGLAGLIGLSVASPVLLGESDPPAAPETAPEHATGIHLGVMLGPVPEALASQLKLQDGQGALVHDVVPGSLAAEAGFARHDLLLAVGETQVQGPAGLQRAIQQYHLGQTVELTVLRGGESIKLPVTLERRHQSIDDRRAQLRERLRQRPEPAERWFHDDLDFDARFDTIFRRMDADMQHMRKRMQRLMQEGHGDDLWPMDLNPHQDALQRLRDVQRQLERFAEPFVPPAEPADFPGWFHARSVSTFSDGQHTIILTEEDGQSRLTVKDRAGEVIFEGPYNTDEDKAAVPDAIRDKVERMDRPWLQIEPREPREPRQPPPNPDDLLA